MVSRIIPRLGAGRAGCVDVHLGVKDLGEMSAGDMLSHSHGGVRELNVQVCCSEEEMGLEDWTFGGW